MDFELGTLILLTVITVCFAALFAQHCHYRFLKEQRDHVDTVKLSDELTAKLAAMEDMKGKMESLLLKNGFGR